MSWLQSFHDPLPARAQEVADPNIGDIFPHRFRSTHPNSCGAASRTTTQTSSLPMQSVCRSGPCQGKFQDDRNAPEIC